MKYLIVLLLAVNLIANDDEELIMQAYESGLKPVPTSFESLLYHLGQNGDDLTKEKVLLGKKLFFDKNLSLKRDISCASCHDFNQGGADGRSTAIGHMNRENPFHLNTPTVLNTAFSKNLFWDGRSDTLHDQAKGPMQAPFEMSITPEIAEKRIQSDQEYTRLFQEAFGNSVITFEKIAKAIAAYEKTLQTKGKYDDFLLGYLDALNRNEKEGLKLFINRGCVGCHNGIGLGGQALRKFPLSYHQICSMATPEMINKLNDQYRKLLLQTNNDDLKDDAQRKHYLEQHLGKSRYELLEIGFFEPIEKSERLAVMTSNACSTCHEKGVQEIKKELAKQLAYPFENRGGFLGAQNRDKYFRVPLLRNSVKTAPYFHNGSVEKLEDAIKIMGTHQIRTNLTDNEIKRIIDFLKAVDGKRVDYHIE